MATRQESDVSSEALVDRLIATAIERGERARTRRIGAYGVGTLAIAAIAIGLVSNDRGDLATRVVDMHPGQQKVIRLAYESRVDRPETTVLVTLSDHIDLIGYAGARDLTWTTTLKKGVNVLELPVVLNTPDEAQLTVAFSSGNDSKQVRVRIRAAGPSVHEVRATPNDPPEALS